MFVCPSNFSVIWCLSRVLLPEHLYWTCMLDYGHLCLEMFPLSFVGIWLYFEISQIWIIYVDVLTFCVYSGWTPLFLPLMILFVNTSFFAGVAATTISSLWFYNIKTKFFILYSIPRKSIINTLCLVIISLMNIH